MLPHEETYSHTQNLTPMKWNLLPQEKTYFYVKKLTPPRRNLLPQEETYSHGVLYFHSKKQTPTPRNLLPLRKIIIVNTSIGLRNEGSFRGTIIKRCVVKTSVTTSIHVRQYIVISSIYCQYVNTLSLRQYIYTVIRCHCGNKPKSQQSAGRT